MGVLFVLILGPHFCFKPRYCFRNSVKKIEKTCFFDLSQNFKISDPLVVSRQMRSLKTSKTPINRLMRFFYKFFQNLNFLIFLELFSWKIILSIAIWRRKKVKVHNFLSFLDFFSSRRVITLKLAHSDYLYSLFSFQFLKLAQRCLKWRRQGKIAIKKTS